MNSLNLSSHDVKKINDIYEDILNKNMGLKKPTRKLTKEKVWYKLPQERTKKPPIPREKKRNGEKLKKLTQAYSPVNGG